MIVLFCGFVVGVATVKAESPLELKMARPFPDFLVDAGPDLLHLI